VSDSSEQESPEESESSDSSSSSSDEDEKHFEQKEYVEDPYEAEEDAAVGAAIGLDLSKFLKKEEFEFHLIKVIQRCEDLQEQIDRQERKLEVEIKEKGYEYTKGLVHLESEVAKAMRPIAEDMKLLLKDKNRSKADDIMLKN